MEYSMAMARDTIKVDSEYAKHINKGVTRRRAERANVSVLTREIVKRQGVITHRNTLLSDGTLPIRHILDTQRFQTFRSVLFRTPVFGAMFVDGRILSLSLCGSLRCRRWTSGASYDTTSA
jgi:hypothetical protein